MPAAHARTAVFDPAAEYARICREQSVRALASVTEKPTQAGLIKWLRTVLPIGSVPFAVVNEAPPASKDDYKRARFFQRRKAAGVVTGFPDIGICLPDAAICFIETKRPVGGVLSAAQQDIHAQLRALGHRVGVATGPESALPLLREWRVQLRNVGDMRAAPAIVRLAKRPAAFTQDRLPI